MDNEEFCFRVNQARSRVAAMDLVDGWKDRELKTVLFAIVSGVKNPTTDGVFDAIAMLEDLTHFKVTD